MATAAVCISRLATAGPKAGSSDGRAPATCTKLGLGATHTVSLVRARERAADVRRLILDGIDPREARRAAAIAEAKSISLANACERYIASHSAGWKTGEARSDDDAVKSIDQTLDHSRRSTGRCRRRRSCGNHSANSPRRQASVRGPMERYRPHLTRRRWAVRGTERPMMAKWCCRSARRSAPPRC